MIGIGEIVDIVLLVLALEALVLLIALRRRPGLPSFISLLPNLAAGGFLVLALRSAISGGSPFSVAGLLALGGMAHALDLRNRLRKGRTAH